MRVSTPLIFEVAQAEGFDRFSPAEYSIEVPAALHLTAEVPRRLTPFSTFVTTQVQRTSFFNGPANQLAASQAAQTLLLCTFGRGLWHLKLSSTFYNSATEVPTLGLRLRLDLADPDGTSSAIMGVGSVANQLVAYALELRLNLAEDGWRLFHFLQATDVAEERLIFSLIWAEKLI